MSFAATVIRSGAVAPAYPHTGRGLHLVRLQERRGRMAWSGVALCGDESTKQVGKWYPYAVGEEPNEGALCGPCRAAASTQEDR